MQITFLHQSKIQLTKRIPHQGRAQEKVDIFFPKSSIKPLVFDLFLPYPVSKNIWEIFRLRAEDSVMYPLKGFRDDGQ